MLDVTERYCVYKWRRRIRTSKAHSGLAGGKRIIGQKKPGLQVARQGNPELSTQNKVDTSNSQKSATKAIDGDFKRVKVWKKRSINQLFIRGDSVVSLCEAPRGRWTGYCINRWESVAGPLRCGDLLIWVRRNNMVMNWNTPLGLMGTWGDCDCAT